MNALRHFGLVRLHAARSSSNYPQIKRNVKRMKLRHRPSYESLSMALAEVPPADFKGLGAWVEHHIASRSGFLSEVLAECLDLPLQMVHTLIDFGAVYYCPIPPRVPDRVSLSGGNVEKEMIEKAKEKIREKLGSNDTRLSTPRRACSGEIICDKYSYFRVHLSPKRFPVFHAIDWTTRLVEDEENYIVINKPPELPTVPTVDNVKESLLAAAPLCLNKAENSLNECISVENEYYVTTRLDHATEGLVILGKTTAFVRKYNELYARSPCKGMKKFYRALTATRIPIGVLNHRVKLNCRLSGTPFFTLVVGDNLSDIPFTNHDKSDTNEVTKQNIDENKNKDHSTKFKSCTLIIHACKEVNLAASAKERFGTSTAWESTIELITGRTHQIRAQLSALEAPILGDALYSPLADANLREKLLMNDPSIRVFEEATGDRLLREADGAIGLQAYRLEFIDKTLFSPEVEDRNKIFDAGKPWWSIQNDK